MTSPVEESFPPLPEQQQPVVVPALPAVHPDLAVHVFPPATHHSEVARGSPDILARLPLELLIDILRYVRVRVHVA